MYVIAYLMNTYILFVLPMQAKFGKAYGAYGETGRCLAHLVMLFDVGIEYIHW